jgi:hypothetical protein
MCNLGREHLKVTQPDLYEANKAELEAITRWNKLEEATTRLIAEKNKSQTPPQSGTAPANPLAESAPPTPPASKPGEQQQQQQQQITEGVENHFALQMLRRNRGGK